MGGGRSLRELSLYTEACAVFWAGGQPLPINGHLTMLPIPACQPAYPACPCALPAGPTRSFGSQRNFLSWSPPGATPTPLCGTNVWLPPPPRQLPRSRRSRSTQRAWRLASCRGWRRRPATRAVTPRMPRARPLRRLPRRQPPLEASAATVGEMAAAAAPRARPATWLLRWRAAATAPG